MRYPDFLGKEGSIGCIAPSFGCATEPYKSAFNHAIKLWTEKFSHQVFLGPNAMLDAGVGISNTPKLCGQEIMDYFEDASCDVLISCGGGELMCEDLDYVNFEKLKALPPKWFMGYSDNTNLTFLLPTLCDTAAIYGPCAAAFGMEPWHEAIHDAYALLRGEKLVAHNYGLYEKESLKDEEHPLEPYHVTEKSVIRAFLGEKEVEKDSPVEFEGRLIGGCMDCLVNLTGTCYDRVKEFADRYEQDGIIWFLEACDLNVMGIRRAVWQMEHAGWFKNVKGFLVGRPVCHGEEMMGMDQYKAVLSVIAHYGKPVLMDLDIGHIAPMMPLISGGYGKVSYEQGKLSVSMECR